MAVNNRLSTQMTNRDAVPRVVNNPGAVAGMLRGFAATVLAVTGDSTGSVYRMAQVPSDAVLHSLVLSSDDLGTTTTVNVGIYDTTANGGAAVSATLFASAFVVNAGAVSKVDMLNNTLSLNTAEQQLWQLLGLSSDPKKNYDICITIQGACDGGGNLALRGSYAF